MEKNRKTIDRELFQRLSKARSLVDHRFSEPLDLDRIAREASLSPFHFQRLFRSIFNLTPQQYRTYRRIERAKELLVYSDFSISEICIVVGFSSLGSFSSLFSREVGLSPVSYRKAFCRRVQVQVLLPERPIAIPHCFMMMGTKPVKR